MHKPSRATDPLISVGYSTVPRGQAVNPSQAGFHFLKREWGMIPFSFGRKKILGRRSPLPTEMVAHHLTSDGGGTSAGVACQ